MIIEVAALVAIAGLVAIGCIGVLSWGDSRPSKAENKPRRVGHWAACWRGPEKPTGNESAGASNVVHADLQRKAHTTPGGRGPGAGRRVVAHRRPISGVRSSLGSTSTR